MDTRHALFHSLGVGYWVTRLADLFLTAQSTSALGMAQHLVGHRNLVKRISPTIRANIGLDNTSEIPSLVGIADSESRKELPSLRALFFQEPLAEVFQPFRLL
jgi:hypothetical protein